MKYIKKGNEPDSLTEHRSHPCSTYDNYQRKDELREYLAGEQGNICCYCMQPIEPNQKKYEEIILQEKTMRHFHSYGPVDCRHHFCVERRYLIEKCTEQLVGIPEEGGHYFTIWASRQAGKTWLMRQVVKKIKAEYGDRFQIGMLSVQGVVMEDEDHEDKFLEEIPMLLYEGFFMKNIPVPENWNSFRTIFDRNSDLFDTPLILFIDEFDSLPLHVIDRLVTMFRDIYLKRENYLLHGLALIGVRAVLGVGSRRGSPFNIQRALNVPNLTRDETGELFFQYQRESGQKIDPEVVENVFRKTKGQPGLVSWFGELLAEKYNPGSDKIIDSETWETVWLNARLAEPNNTVLNLIAKAQLPEYREILMAVFSQADVPFAFHDPVCNYLFLNGIIESYDVREKSGKVCKYCRFSSPFVQECIHSALGMEMMRTLPVRALDPLDDLSDVLDVPELNLPALMDRYQDYLRRLKAAGHEIWKDRPLRADLRIREALGHFHLYAWLCNALGRDCAVTPEFPTGNGQVDIHIRCDGKEGIIEVKSFSNLRQIKKAKKQSAEYAAGLGMNAVTVVVFISDADENILEKISSEEVTDSIRVTVRAIGI
ncbi:MAG: hypothetical protein GY749_22095 [Desulfobacteraceae bacterium]|nr:hypothetical protein [Desulfobacteraceae bacterium]